MAENNENQDRDPKTGRMLPLYRPEYDAMLIKHLEEGLMYQTFAAVVNVNIDTIYEWEKKYPSFKEAKEVGKPKFLFYWEKLGMLGIRGKIPHFNTSTWIFSMKNHHGWRNDPEKNLVKETDEFTHEKIMKYIEGKEF